MNRFLRRGLVVMALVLGVMAWPQTTQGQGDGLFLPQVSNGEPALCRFGVNGATKNYPIRPLRLGWYMDYQATRTPQTAPGMEYFPMIRLEQVGDGYNYSIFVNRAATTPAQLEAVIAAHPGAYWFIGNEPDRIQFQDDIEPRVYALAYRDLYHLIKAHDPSAKIIAGSIVQPTPLRLQYLDLILQSYYELTSTRMPVDAWAFHNFILNEASCAHYAQVFPNDPNRAFQECWGADIPPGINATDGLRIDVQLNADAEIFKQQVVAFRRWMAERGYRDTPAFLSEFGVLMPKGIFSPDFDEARVNAFMRDTMHFLLDERDATLGYPGDDNRLVQRFSWYSVEDKNDHNGFLFDYDLPRAQSRTVMGDNLAQITAAVGEDVDFYPTQLRQVGPAPLAVQGVVTLTLEATIANSGNSAMARPATVRFYNGDPAQGGVPIGADQTIYLQGCGEAATVQVTWPNVTPATYRVFVEVLNAGAEVSTANNRLQATVSFVTGQTYLPSTQRSFALR